MWGFFWAFAQLSPFLLASADSARGILASSSVAQGEAVKPLASPAARGIFDFMAETAGQLVSVSTRTVEGGETPTYSAVVVAEPDPKKAEQLVKESAAHSEKVEAIGLLPASVVNLFGLKPGQFTPWR